MMKKSIDASLVQFRTLISNASRHPKVKPEMEKFGYTDPRMQEAQSLLDQFILWQNEKENCYSQGSALKQKLKQDVKSLKVLYTGHLTIARFAFREDAYMEAHLQLKGTRKSDWAGWTSQVLSFYSRVEAEGLAAMKKHGAKAEELSQGKAMAEALADVYQQKKSNAGDAQSATQKRNAAFKALTRWVSDYKKIARVALQNDPQIMEVLGIVVPSEA